MTRLLIPLPALLMYRPVLKGKVQGFTPTAEDLALSRGQTGDDPTRCHHPRHAKGDVCPGCGCRFGKTWWAKFYVHGKAVRESTETEKETEAARFLKRKEGAAASGQPVLPRVERILYDEAAADLWRHYRTTGGRDPEEAKVRLAHLGLFVPKDPERAAAEINLPGFFTAKRLSGIGPADVTRYIHSRQDEGAANGTINRELTVLGRMLRLAYENGKLMRLPLIHKLKEGAPPGRLFRTVTV